MKKILTNVRIDCLEELAQKTATELAPEDTTKIRPEIQEVIRYQCAEALNVPVHKMNEEHAENLQAQYDLIYKTNVLSSIMNIENIATHAVDYASKLGDASDIIIKNIVMR